MIDLTPKAFAILRRQHGHASVRQLAEAGVGRNARRRLIEGQELVAVHRSVLRISSAPLTFESRCVGSVSLIRSGFITGPSGGRLVGLRRMPAAEPIHFCVPHGIHLFDSGVVVRQSRNVTAARLRAPRKRDRRGQRSPLGVRLGQRPVADGPRLCHRADDPTQDVHDGKSGSHGAAPVPSNAPRLEGVRSHTDRPRRSTGVRVAP